MKEACRTTPAPRHQRHVGGMLLIVVGVVLIDLQMHAVSVLGVAVLDDHLTRPAWVGIGLVVLGVGTMNLQPSNRGAGSRAKEPDELPS